MKSDCCDADVVNCEECGKPMCTGCMEGCRCDHSDEKTDAV